MSVNQTISCLSEAQTISCLNRALQIIGRPGEVNFSVFTSTIRGNKSFVKAVVTYHGVEGLLKLLACEELRIIEHGDICKDNENQIRYLSLWYYPRISISPMLLANAEQIGNDSGFFLTVYRVGKVFCGFNLKKACSLGRCAVQFKLLNDIDFVRDLLKICPRIFELLCKEVKDIPFLYYEAICNSPCMVKHLSRTVIEDFQMWKTVLTEWTATKHYLYYRTAIQAIPVSIRENDDLMSELIQINILVLPLATGSISNDPGLCDRYTSHLYRALNC